MPKLPPAPKNPRQKPVVVRQRVPLQLVCEWSECARVFSNMNEYIAHVTGHLEDVMKESTNNSHETGSCFMSLQCLWTECGHEIGDDFLELMRHVYFHAFHTKIKSIGHTFAEQRSLPVCTLDTASRNMIPELPERMVCSWKNCARYYDNPQDFYDHVTVHQESFPDGNHVPGGCRCQWTGCETTVKSRYKLREHLRSHTQEKLVACPTCGGLFSNYTRFTDHITRQQVVESGFQCSHCSKNFPNERLLRDHMRCHVNHYKCPLCDMTCPNPSSVRNHIKYRHSEERTFPCTQCKFAGKSQSDLRRHMDTHSENEYYCHIPDCEYSCRTYGALSKHFKETHQGLKEVPRHACHLCGRLFLRGERLTNHLKTVHKFKWPSGHRRFRYKENEDGFLRLQTIRYESIELTEEIMANKGRGKKPDHKTPGGVSRKLIPQPEEEEGEGEEGASQTDSTVSTVKVSRKPLIVQDNKPSLGEAVAEQSTDTNKRKRSTGVSGVEAKKSRTDLKEENVSQAVAQTSVKSHLTNQTVKNDTSVRGTGRRNLRKAFDSVAESSTESAESAVVNKLVIDDKSKKSSGCSRRKLQKKPPTKSVKSLTEIVHAENKTTDRDNKTTRGRNKTATKVNKRKGVSPQKRLPMSPERTHVDMPMSLMSPLRDSTVIAGSNSVLSGCGRLNTNEEFVPGLTNSAVNNNNNSGSSNNVEGSSVVGAQRRKLMSPSKKYIDMPLLTFEEENNMIAHSRQAITENIPVHGVAHSIDNVIHISNDYTELGMQGAQVAQPIFTVNSSPTKYMKCTSPNSSFSTLKAAALSSGIFGESVHGNIMHSDGNIIHSDGNHGEEEDVETTARELGIHVQL